MNALARTKSAAETMLDLQFAALAGRDPAANAAFAAFAEKGLPTRRAEAWHYTDLRAAMREAAAPSSRPDAARIAAARVALGPRPDWAAARLVIVDGRFVEELSDPTPSGAKRGRLAPEPVAAGRSTEIADPAYLLNLAFAPPDGLVLIVEEKLGRPIEIAHYSSGEGADYSCLSLHLQRNAAATVVQSFVGATPATQRNARTLIRLDAGAELALVSQFADEPAIHLETQDLEVGRDAAFQAFGLVAGGAFVRRQIFATQREQGASISLSGLSLIDGARLADTTLTVTHEAPRGKSREFFRHIVADHGVGVYQGKVVVAPQAQKTDGGMKSQALLLSPTAQMNNKPELEIFADDVVCGHGATVGALDPEQIFYLQSRGLPKRQAEAMLLEAFGVEAIERVADEGVAEALTERLRDWLKRRAA